MSFPFKEDEAESPHSIRTQSKDYKDSVRIIRRKLTNMGYEVAEAVAKFSDKKQMKGIANLLARNPHNNVEMACLISLPKTKTTSVKRLMNRIEKIVNLWNLTGVWLCVHREGNDRYANFPMIGDRLLKKFPQIRVFSLDLDTDLMKPIFRWDDAPVEPNQKNQE